jgi:hypothetical protein
MTKSYPFKPPRTATASGTSFFLGMQQDLAFLHFVTDTVLVGDFVAHIARVALDGGERDKSLTPVELAKSKPGNRTKELRRQSQRMLEMLLARAVDNFEKYIVDLLREVLRQQPSMLKSKQHSLTLEDILSHGSIDELVHSIIESKVNGLSYEGFASIQEWCAARGITLSVPEGATPLLVEYLATRNVIVHNRCHIDEKYLRTVSGSARKIGDLRDIDVDDFIKCTELLLESVKLTDKSVSTKFRLKRKALPTFNTTGVEKSSAFKGGEVPPNNSLERTREA